MSVKDEKAKQALKKLGEAYMQVLRVEFRSAPTAVTISESKLLVAHGWGRIESFPPTFGRFGGGWTRIWLTDAGKQALNV